MTILDPKTGLPIIGAHDPQQEYRDHLLRLRDEKQNLAPDDHDWVVLIAYALTERDAERAAVANETNIPAQPSIPVTNETMRNHEGPLCARCKQDYRAVKDAPCPGMSFEEYLAQLPPPIREEVLRRLQSGEVPKNARIDVTPEGDVTVEEIVDLDEPAEPIAES